MIKIIAGEAKKGDKGYFVLSDGRLGEFTADDGNEHKSLVLRAFSDERVVICGNIVLHPEWKPFRKGIVQADVPSDFDVDLLTVNDVIRPLARYPNYDSTAIRFNGVSADATSPKRVKRWKNPAG